jgi:hypothetical protein
MENVGLPKGLIRYASEDNISKKVPFRLTARMKGYSAVLGILIFVLIGMLFLRNDLEATILRLPGQLYQAKENNIISNVYTYKLVNKTSEDIDQVNYKLLSHKGEIKVVSNQDITIPRQGLAEGTLFIELHSSLVKGDKVKLKIGVFSNGELIETASTNFLGPRTYR